MSGNKTVNAGGAGGKMLKTKTLSGAEGRKKIKRQKVKSNKATFL